MKDNAAPVVSLAKCASYEPDQLKAAIIASLAPHGGMSSFVNPGAKVLLKPNFLAPVSPDSPVCTNPSFILAVGDLVAECGGSVIIGDSPALTRAQAVASKIGLLDESEKRGFKIVDFTHVTTRSGEIYHSIELAEECLDADVLINLPRFKTHSMMEMTTGLKNLFGCVVGKRKAAYHLHVRESREMFARLLLDIVDAVKPALTILDGVVGMEGDGPRGGSARHIGLIAASAECWAIDMAAAIVAGYKPEDIPVLKEMSARLERQGRCLDIQLVGDDVSSFLVKDFKRPKSFPLSFRVPDWLRKPLRRLVLPVPAVNAEKCIGCGNCAKACPASVITIENARARIDKSKCIHCFCCAEVCPVKAIDVVPPALPFFRH